jgi:hypothetical protein
MTLSVLNVLLIDCGMHSWVAVVDGYVRVVQLPVEYLKEGGRERERERERRIQGSKCLTVTNKLNRY